MGFLRSIARTGARATGRALSSHVLPDSLVPSWKTQKRLSTGYDLLKKATRKAGKKKKPAPSTNARTPYKSPALATVSRPGPKAPKKKFDKQGWGMGRSLPGGSDGSVFSPPSATPPRSGLRRKLVDAARNPRLVAQMGLDLLKVDYQHKKDTFLSKLKHTVKTAQIVKKAEKLAPVSGPSPRYHNGYAKDSKGRTIVFLERYGDYSKISYPNGDGPKFK